MVEGAWGQPDHIAWTLTGGKPGVEPGCREPRRRIRRIGVAFTDDDGTFEWVARLSALLKVIGRPFFSRYQP